jgi:hypothetical protein
MFTPALSILPSFPGFLGCLLAQRSDRMVWKLWGRRIVASDAADGPGDVCGGGGGADGGGRRTARLEQTERASGWRLAGLEKAGFQPHPTLLLLLNSRP